MSTRMVSLLFRTQNVILIVLQKLVMTRRKHRQSLSASSTTFTPKTWTSRQPVGPIYSLLTFLLISGQYKSCHRSALCGTRPSKPLQDIRFPLPFMVVGFGDGTQNRSWRRLTGPLTIRLYSGYKSGQEWPKIGCSPRYKSGQKPLRGVDRQILVRTGLSRRKATAHMSAGQPQDAAMV